MRDDPNPTYKAALKALLQGLLQLLHLTGESNKELWTHETISSGPRGYKVLTYVATKIHPLYLPKQRKDI